MRHMKKRRDSRGFLLFEVMMSVAVVTAGMLFVVRPFTTAKVSAERSREILAASILAENKMQSLIGLSAANEGRQYGDFSENGRYGWSVDSVKSGSGDIDEVTVSVYAKNSPGQTLASIATYINRRSYVKKAA